MSGAWAKYGLLWIVLTVLIQARDLESWVEEESIALLEINTYMKSYAYPKYRYFSGLDDGERDKYNHCTWARIHCNPASGRVAKLDLGSMVTYKVGPDGFALGDDLTWLFDVTMFRPFRELKSLDLSNNTINGLVEKGGSPRISSLKNLQTLILDDNDFWDSEIFLGDLTLLKKLTMRDCSWLIKFKELAKLTKLKVLDLTANRYHGSGSLQDLLHFRELQVLRLGISAYQGGSIEGLCEFKNLVELDLGENCNNGGSSGSSFYASLPSCLHNFSSLQVLELKYNCFEGMFPDMLLNHASLKHLSLSNNNFGGKFPNIISNLTSLEFLDLSDNHFEGKLPLSYFANFSKLQFLDLSRNQLKVETESPSWQPSFQLQHLGLQNCSLNKPDGIIPKFLSHQYNLSSIVLSDNGLVGFFPTWLLSNNSGLKDLELANNSLTGYLKLPSYRSSLDTLVISGNNFHGMLPENVGLVFPDLSDLEMSRNHFEGRIPTSVGDMEKLSVLDLSHNNLVGEVPRQLLTDRESLKILQLADNNLQGDIIPEHMNLPNLRWLKLSNNRFGGTMKDALCKSTKLNYLDLSNNKVTGQLPNWIGNFGQFSSSLDDSYKLDTLITSKNFLQGQIPMEICKLGQWLRHLDLSQNNFSGVIPSCSSFQLLNYMHLQKNSLTGPIPTAFSSNKFLETLDLRDNHLSGSIPSWMNELVHLQILLLGGNSFHGQIPCELCQLHYIGILDLSHNNLSGEIPPCLANMSFGMLTNGIPSRQLEVVAGTRGLFTMSDEVEFLVKNQYLLYINGVLRLMSGLDLSCNNFSGIIPSELGNLTHVRSLNLSHNCLSGPIPWTFSNLKQIESLDLSFNKLIGIIPYQLVNLYSLEIFNVSYNNLTGRTLEAGQFGTFDESNYYGNPGLCGLAVNKPCNGVPSNGPSPLPLAPEKMEMEEDLTQKTSYGALACPVLLHLWHRLWYYASIHNGEKLGLTLWSGIFFGGCCNLGLSIIIYVWTIIRKYIS